MTATPPTHYLVIGGEMILLASEPTNGEVMAHFVLYLERHPKWRGRIISVQLVKIDQDGDA